MKRITIALLTIFVIAGCQTVSPVRQVVHKSRMNVGFEDVPVSWCIIFLVAKVNTGWQPPKREIARIDEGPTPEMEAEQAKFDRLHDFCRDKKITLRIDECAPLDLLAFLTRCAGVGYEFRGDRIVLLLPDGSILGAETNPANKAPQGTARKLAVPER